MIRRILLTLGLALGLLAWLGLASAVQDPVVVRYTVPIAGLAKPLRVVQLSDVHGSPMDMPLVRVRRIVAMANALAPDVTVLTGDYFGGKIVDLPGFQLHQVVGELDGLKARLGVVAVPGNHDEPYWVEKVFAATHIRFLRGQFVDLGPLVVAGADSISFSGSPAMGLRRAIDMAPAGKPLISMSHEPETAQFILSRSQLHIAGHTHGGQIWLPGLDWLGAGPLADKPFLLAHRRGLFRLGGRWLVVSSGLGTSIIPVRLGVPPEIVVIELVPDYSVGRNSGTER